MDSAVGVELSHRFKQLSGECQGLKNDFIECLEKVGAENPGTLLHTAKALRANSLDLQLKGKTIECLALSVIMASQESNPALAELIQKISDIVRVPLKGHECTYSQYLIKKARVILMPEEINASTRKLQQTLIFIKSFLGVNGTEDWSLEQVEDGTRLIKKVTKYGAELADLLSERVKILNDTPVEEVAQENFWNKGYVKLAAIAIAIGLVGAGCKKWIGGE